MDRRQFVASALSASLLTLAGRQFAWSAPFGPKLKWQKDLKVARKIAVADHKLLMVVFTAEWCAFCHKLIDSTISHRDLAPFVDRHFVPVMIDFDENKRIAEILEVDSLPNTVILSPQADLLVQRKGFASVASFKETLQAALDKQAEIVQVRAAAGR
ncbi:MAG TPA: thioredoxin family protein [Planctomycetaceae bacterium]|nr:thioredoxin family protein [Planctomycetaceae bacterium]